MKKTILTLLLMTAFTTLGCLAQTTNPLLEDWKTPPFSRIKNEHYAPALRAAMQEQQQAVQQIVDQRSKPTFDNTILALELSGERLELVCGILFNINECYTNDELQNIVMELTPELTRHQNGIMLNDRLFARVKTLYDKRER
ncbi:MAG: peptidase M3, partial [Bacteroidales bacterium]|nr:peptidase M3 [Bacteroidales bacterium]